MFSVCSFHTPDVRPRICPSNVAGLEVSNSPSYMSDIYNLTLAISCSQNM